MVLQHQIFRFLPFSNYLPFEKGMALHLNKPEFPLPKNALCRRVLC